MTPQLLPSGLVAVDPARRGQHLGDAVMAEVAAALSDLELPFGFLTCGTEVTAFYRKQGWHLTGQPLHAIGVHHRIETDRSNGMVLPVRHPLTDWPRGLLARDGQEI